MLDYLIIVISATFVFILFSLFDMPKIQIHTSSIASQQFWKYTSFTLNGTLLSHNNLVASRHFIQTHLILLATSSTFPPVSYWITHV